MTKTFSTIKAISMSAFFVLLGHVAQAQILNSDTAADIADQADIMGSRAGFNETMEVGTVLSTVISAFLGMMGIVFLVLIILAGFNWMTANGEEAKVTKAQDTIKRAVIGLIIIVAAYAITAFVFKSLDSANI